MLDKYKASEEEWNQLFDIVKEAMDLEMWNDFCDGNLVRMYKKRATKKTYACIMGNSGITYGISLAIGDRGLYGINLMTRQDELGLNYEDNVFRQDTITVYFEARKEVEKNDFYLDHIKNDFNYIIYKDKYIHFQRCLTNHFPYNLEKEDVLYAIEYYKMLIDAYKYYKNNHFEINMDAQEVYTYYINSEGVERAKIEDRLDYYDFTDCYRLLDEEINEFKKYKKSKINFEIDINYIEASVTGRHKETAVGRAITIVDKESGFVIHAECPKHNVFDEQAIIYAVYSAIKKIEVLPMKILVRNGLIKTYLRTFEDDLNIGVFQVEELQKTKEVIELLNQNIGGSTINGVQ